MFFRRLLHQKQLDALVFNYQGGRRVLRFEVAVTDAPVIRSKQVVDLEWGNLYTVAVCVRQAIV